VSRSRPWHRLRYRFDNAMSRGTLPVIAWLAAGVLTVIVLGAFIIVLAGSTFGGQTDRSFLESMWQTMLRVIDGGTFVGDAGWGVRLLSLVVTIFGITVAALLIGLISTAIGEKVDDLRRGRSPVVEHDHTLVLGWSPRVFTVVSEIIAADESRSDSAIVVLADIDKQAMEHEFAHRLRNTGQTRLVCRSGDPSSLHDLDRVAIAHARSVVVLGDVEADGDAQVVKTVLATLIRLGAREIPVVAELSEAETGRALREAGPGRVLVVRAPEIIARVTAQACRQPGLSAVWQDLLDFAGDEIYFHPADDLVGRTFGEAQLGFDRAAVLGRRAADGTVAVSPAADVAFEPGDHVIVLAEDDDAITFTGFTEPEASADEAGAGRDGRGPEHVLLIGWNPMASAILTELDRFVVEGSTVDVLVDVDLVPSAELVDPGLHRLGMSCLPANRANLDCLADQVRERDYDVVLILGYRSLGSAAAADARTLLTLLLVQQAAPGPVRVVTELMDSANIELAIASGGDDYVVSDALSGYLMAQLAENPELGAVFDVLFEGSDLVLRLAPAAGYVTGSTTFAEVVTSARRRDEVALGYQAASDNLVTLNPSKAAPMTLTPADRVVVISRT
jgi:Trk K+ transport system NAD-binding subunit